jgi:hypothetical protein
VPSRSQTVGSSGRSLGGVRITALYDLGLTSISAARSAALPLRLSVLVRVKRSQH